MAELRVTTGAGADALDALRSARPLLALEPDASDWLTARADVGNREGGPLGIAAVRRAAYRSAGSVALCAVWAGCHVSPDAPEGTRAALAEALRERLLAEGDHLLLAFEPVPTWALRAVGQMRIGRWGAVPAAASLTPVSPNGDAAAAVLERADVTNFLRDAGEINDRRLHRVCVVESLRARTGEGAGPFAARFASGRGGGALAIYAVAESATGRHLAVVDLVTSFGPAGVVWGRRVVADAMRAESAASCVAGLPRYAWPSVALRAAGFRAAAGPTLHVYVTDGLDHTIDHLDIDRWRLDLGDLPGVWPEAP